MTVERVTPPEVSDDLPERMARLADRLEQSAQVAVEPVAKTWLRAAEAIRDVLMGADA